jgi:MinD superfamily P-loop ATPase
MVDCDVDAADLYLLLHHKIIVREDFCSGKIASIDKEICLKYYKCIEVCKFSAIGESFVADAIISCEGCGICRLICPVKAIMMEESLSVESLY